MSTKIIAQRACHLTLVLFAAACASNGGSSDGGIGDGGSPIACPADNQDDRANALAVVADEPTTGFTCPRGDIDYYTITIPAGESILNVRLVGTAAISRVDLVYQLQDAAGTALFTSPTKAEGFNDRHCLSSGQYFIVVSDDANDDEDRINPYQLTLSTAADNDTTEPNDGIATSVALDKDGAPPSNTGTGRISCIGDQDYFSVSLTANEYNTEYKQLLDVTLTTTAITNVDFKYTIYDDQMTAIGTQSHLGGTRSAVNLNALHALPAEGTYYIVVEDEGGDDTDAALDYNLVVAAQIEQDVQDRSGRNDDPASATVIGSYTGGTPASPWPLVPLVATGQIASRADVDYFRINGINFDYNTAGVIEIELAFTGPGGTSTVQPQVALVYGDPLSPCSSDNCCRVLAPDPNPSLTGPSCGLEPGGLDDQCLRRSYSCITKGSLFCGDSLCEPAPALTCSTEQRCAGLASCLPGGSCGAEIATISDNTSGDGAYILTAQPLIHNGPWYIRVGDVANDDYDYGNYYTLTVSIASDPDAPIEWDNEYIPPQVLITGQSVGRVNELHEAARKTTREATVVEGPDNFDPSSDGGVGSDGIPDYIDSIRVQGHLSFGRDEDRFRYPWPCPQEDGSGNPVTTCTAQATLTKTGTCPAGLNFVFTIEKPGGDVQIGLVNQSSFTFGDGQPNNTPQGGCFVFNQAFVGEKRWIVVRELERDSWGWDCEYELLIDNIQAGCNAPCCCTSSFGCTTNPGAESCAMPPDLPQCQ